MLPAFYRWLHYGCARGRATRWYVATPGKLARACRALRMPGETLEVLYSNGQRVTARVKLRRR